MPAEEAALPPRPARFGALTGYATASPELLAERALLRRVDTKFVLEVEDLDHILERVRGDYALLLARGRPIARYRTLYYDTADLQCLVDHTRGRRPRYKVRVRHYLDRELSYLEVKKKTSADRTEKQRRRVPFLSNRLGPEELDFIDRFSNLRGSELTPSLWTDFDRITLVGLRTPERVTIDLRLRFDDGVRAAETPRVAISEVKQARYSARSPIMLAHRDLRIRPLSLSKYCTAAAMLVPEVSMRCYRPRIRDFRRLDRG